MSAGHNAATPCPHCHIIVRRKQRPVSGESICRRGSVPGAVAGLRLVTIHLCGPPEAWRRCRRRTDRPTPRLTLLRMGFTEPAGSPRPLVRSYRTFSPLPARGPAVGFLWHFPAGHPDWPLASILSCGAPTFLSLRPEPPTAVTRWTHPTTTTVPQPESPASRTRPEILGLNPQTGSSRQRHHPQGRRRRGSGGIGMIIEVSA